MIFNRFNALLKTEDDKLLEIGFASVSDDNGTVDFENEFVPLLKLGTVAKIVRIVENEETHCFIGKVYLSSRQLLQLVDVKDYLMSDTEKCIPTDISMDGMVIPISTNAVVNPHAKNVPVNIYSISLNSIKFMSKEEFDVGQQLLLNTESPIPLGNVLVQVVQLISFGEKFIGHRCTILSLPEPSYKRLSEFMEYLNTVFPQ